MGWLYPSDHTIFEAGPELSLDTTLLASEAMGLMHGLSSGPHHLCAVSLCRLEADSKALRLRSAAMKRNAPFEDVPLENTSLPLDFTRSLPCLRSCTQPL